MKIHGVDLIAQGDMVVQSFRKHGNFEPESMAVWREHCGPGKTAIDVGAYTGIYSLVAASLGADVIAIEPAPESANRLRKNATNNRLSDKISLHRCAAGAETGHCNLSVKFPLSSANAVDGSYDTTIAVEKATVDSFVLERHVNIMKIDVEGYEFEVLVGAEETIRRCKPVIITEALTRQDIMYQDAELSNMGYELVRTLDKRNILWLPKER